MVLSEGASNLDARKQIWAIAGGKGGTGKTLVASSLGILLSKMGYKVVVIDADLGGANLHTCFGIRNPEATLSDLFDKRSVTLESILTETSYAGLRILSGSNDILNIANVHHLQKLKLIRNIKSLDADFIILDLGAGTTYNVLDFFIMADIGLLVALPEPTSIENMYRFLKSTVLRIIKNILPQEMYNRLMNSQDLSSKGQFKTVHNFLKHIESENRGFAESIESKIRLFTPKIIINQVRTNEDIILGRSIKDLTVKYLGVNLDCIGYIPFDQRIHYAIKRFRPFISQEPNCNAAMCINMLLKKILESNALSSKK